MNEIEKRMKEIVAQEATTINEVVPSDLILDVTPIHPLYRILLYYRECGTTKTNTNPLKPCIIDATLDDLICKDTFDQIQRFIADAVKKHFKEKHMYVEDVTMVGWSLITCVEDVKEPKIEWIIS